MKEKSSIEFNEKFGFPVGRFKQHYIFDSFSTVFLTNAEISKISVRICFHVVTSFIFSERFLIKYIINNECHIFQWKLEHQENVFKTALRILHFMIMIFNLFDKHIIQIVLCENNGSISVMKKEARQTNVQLFDILHLNRSIYTK